MNKVFVTIFKKIVELVSESWLIGIATGLISDPSREVRRSVAFRDTLNVTLMMFRIYLYGRAINETSQDGSKNSQYVPDFIETRFEDLMSGGTEIASPFIINLNDPILTTGDTLDVANYLELI